MVVMPLLPLLMGVFIFDTGMSEPSATGQGVPAGNPATTTIPDITIAANTFATATSASTIATTLPTNSTRASMMHASTAPTAFPVGPGWPTAFPMPGMPNPGWGGELVLAFWRGSHV